MLDRNFAAFIGVCLFFNSLSAEISIDGRLDDQITTLVYRPSDGNLWLETPQLAVTTIEIRSDDEIFTKQNPLPIWCGLIDPCFTPTKLFKLDPNGFLNFNFGTRVAPNLPKHVISDWRVAGSNAGGGGLSGNPDMNQQPVDVVVTGDLGDSNGTGHIDFHDVNALTRASWQSSPLSLFDLNSDGAVDVVDRHHLIVDLGHYWYGDANLDGLFDSRDLVKVFVESSFEDGIPNNSTWQSGDFDGDGEFTTGDLVLAFEDGGYDVGRRNPVRNNKQVGHNEIGSVPEPNDLWLTVLMIAFCLRNRLLVAKKTF